MAVAILGAPRTTRQNRNFAIAVLVLGILVLRIAGFGLSTVSTSRPAAIIVQYFMLAGVSAASVWMIMRGIIIDVPANLLGRITGLFGRIASLRPQ
jgi:lipopolysaccharide export system permease protein